MIRLDNYLVEQGLIDSRNKWRFHIDYFYLSFMANFLCFSFLLALFFCRPQIFHLLLFLLLSMYLCFPVLVDNKTSFVTIPFRHDFF